jgi:hypothetical protein
VERSASLPVYALRAENGGAVVIFVTYNQFSWTAQSAAAQLPKTNTQVANQSEEPGPAGGLISTPFYCGGLLSITKN